MRRRTRKSWKVRYAFGLDVSVKVAMKGRWGQKPTEVLGETRISIATMIVQILLAEQRHVS